MSLIDRVIYKNAQVLMMHAIFDFLINLNLTTI